MTDRKIPATESLEVYISEGRSIVLLQQPENDDAQVVVIQLRDVETVRQWLAELYAEATAGE